MIKQELPSKGLLSLVLGEEVFKVIKSSQTDDNDEVYIKYTVREKTIIDDVYEYTDKYINLDTLCRMCIEYAYNEGYTFKLWKSSKWYMEIYNDDKYIRIIDGNTMIDTVINGLEFITKEKGLLW